MKLIITISTSESFWVIEIDTNEVFKGMIHSAISINSSAGAIAYGDVYSPSVAIWYRFFRKVLERTKEKDRLIECRLETPANRDETGTERSIRIILSRIIKVNG